MQPITRFGRTALFTLLLAVCLLGLLQLYRSAGDKWRALDPSGDRQARSAANAPIEVVDEDQASPRASAERRSEAPALVEPAETIQPLVVSGLLADERSGLPLASHTLILAWHPTDDPPRKATATTGTNGEFRFELAGEHWKTGRYYSAQVIDPHGQELFRGLLLLQSELVLPVAPRPVLAGVLKTQPPLDYPGVLLRVWTPPAQALPTQLLCGETRLSADGSFSLAIDEPVPSDELLLVFSDRTGGFADATLPRMIIAAGLAPTIERDLVEVEIAIRTSAGGPVAGAAVRVFPLGESGAIRWNILTTDAEGRVRLRLQVGAYELCAGSAGHQPVVETFDLSPQAQPLGIDLLLEPLRETDLVRGDVFAQDGTPVEGALVTARPLTVHAELAQPGRVTARTGASGAFELAAPTDRQIVLSAEHPEHGRVELAPLVAADVPVSIVFEPLGSIEVRPESNAAESPISSGPMQYFLVERGGERVESGYSNGCPWVIEGVVAGDYDVFLMAHGQASYAEGSVVVPLRSVASIEVALVPSMFFTGRLVDDSGIPLAGLEVELAHPYWPERVVRAWSTVTSGMDGTFRLFAGNRQEGVVRVVRQDAELARVDLRAGVDATIRVP